MHAARARELRLALPVIPGITPKVSFDSLPRNALTDALDGFIRRVGEISSYIWLVLVAVIVVNVTLRHVFGRGYILFEEIQWHLYAVGFLLGLSYTMLREGHVRVDILSEHWPMRRRVWVEFVGLVFLLAPLIVFVLLNAVPYVERAWTLNEISAAPGGLAYRWIIKSFIIWGFLLLAITMTSRLIRCALYLFAPRGT
jgi:TRAP-type mannitol/chloroaromatic compound transport system permease small subunit